MTTDRLLERNSAGPLPLQAVRAPSFAGACEPSQSSTGEGLEAGPGSGLSVACAELEDLILVSLEGQLDVYTTPAFRTHMRRHDPAEVQLVIDLTGVRLLGAAGLSALVGLRNEAHRGGGSVGLICPHGHLARLFWVTGLRRAFAFGENLTAVRAALAERRNDHVGAGHAAAD